jgi:cell volume regulation protein A
MSISIEFLLLFLSVIVLISLLAAKISARFGVPVLLLFLLIGMLFGSDGIGFNFENIHIAQGVGTAALCLILFAGGLDTNFTDIKPVVKPGLILSTLGVLITAIVAGAIIYGLFYIMMPKGEHLSILESLLLGSIMSSTDSASVFAILRSKGISLKNNLKPLLELESGSNDPMAYMLTITLIQLIVSPFDANAGLMAIVWLVIQLAVGLLLGYFLGKATVWFINKINLNNDSLYPVLLLTCGLFIFSVTYYLKGNGYLSVYIAGLVIGNSKFIHKKSSLRFFSGLAWLSQIMMFLMLGLLVNPSELIPIIGIGLIIGFGLMLLARPISVFISLIPFRRIRIRDKLFVSWVGLRGAVPIIFAIFPLVADIPHAQLMFNIVFFITLVSLLLQGSFISHVADFFKLSEGKRNKKIQDFAIEFSVDVKSTMSEITITESVLSKGSLLLNLSLPEKTLVVMIKRDERYFIPKGNTELLVGDRLLIITDDEQALVETYQSLGISEYNIEQV